MSWSVAWDVSVNGVSMTGRMRDYLTDLSVTDTEGETSDTCNLTLEDTGGQLRLPVRGAKVAVRLNGVSVFAGVITGVTSSCSRTKGRMLKVSAKGFDDRGKVKEPQRFHLDDASLDDFLNRAAQNAGLSGVSVDPDFASVTRDYWAADTESFLHIGQRLAREFNATFKIRMDRAVFVPRGKDAGLPPVIGNADGGNVTSWSIQPMNGRRDFTDVEVSYFDREAAEVKTETARVGSDRDMPGAVNRIRSLAFDKDQAKDVAEARAAEADNEAGSGSVSLNITPEAQAEALFILTGARAGVDGTYRIASRTHSAGCSGGAKTTLQLKQPRGGAGRDSR